MAASFNRLSSSTDSSDGSRYLSWTPVPTSILQLRKTLNQQPEQFIDFPDTTSDNNQQFGTPIESILKDNCRKIHAIYVAK